MDVDEPGDVGAMPADDVLAAAARRGDERAFAELHRRYEPAARRSARRAARKVAHLDVDEVVNVAMARLWRALRRYDGDGGEFSHWAAVVIANAVRNAVEAAMTQKSRTNWSALLHPGDADADPPLDRVADTGPGAEELVLRREEDAAVRAELLRVLSPREADVMRLRLSGWTYAEIADRLGLEVKGVDNAVRRATQKLRDRVAGRRG